MTSPILAAVDPSVPRAVSLDRVVMELHLLGLEVQSLEAGRATRTVVDHVPVLFAFDTTGRFLSIRCIWDTTLHKDVPEHHLFAAADSWNRAKFFPTVYWTTTNRGCVQVCADFTCDTKMGLTDAQLRDCLDTGIYAGVCAIQFMQHAVEKTLGWMPTN